MSYYDLAICRIPIAFEVQDYPEGSLSVRGFEGVSLDQERLARARDEWEREPVLAASISDNGSCGDGIFLQVDYRDRRVNERPLFVLGMTDDQARTLHAAIGSVLKMRRSETPESPG